MTKRVSARWNTTKPVSPACAVQFLNQKAGAPVTAQSRNPIARALRGAAFGSGLQKLRGEQRVFLFGFSRGAHGMRTLKA